MSTNPLADALDNPQPAPQMAAPGDVGPELDRYEDADPFPPGCPVQVLGNQQDIEGNQKCFYLNYNGQLVGLQAGNKHGKLAMAALFGPRIGWLEANWPQRSKPVTKTDKRTGEEIVVRPSEIVGFDQAKAAEALVIEATRRGIFDPAGRMRGRGAHRIGGADGAHGQGLALHCGDQLLISELKVDGSIKGWTWHDPGLHGRFVYPAAEAIPRPWHEQVGEKPGMQVFGLLQRWYWRRPLLDPLFVFGAIGASLVGGFLPWRPNLWITGKRGCGKSTLNGKDGLVHRLFGEGVFRTGNTTSAGIRQSLLNSTVPVMIDEAEAGVDNRKLTEVVALARVASSGDTMSRGGADHKAIEFTLRSVFWFSSINRPPMEPQDLSRLALCELLKIPEGTEQLELDDFPLAKLGRQLQRRMIDGVARLAATKRKFHKALAAMGHEIRACDQFGTLLACADVLMNDWSSADGLPSDADVADWTALCRPEQMTEISGATSEERLCIEHVITSPLQSRGGEEREAIGTWIGRAVACVEAPLLNEHPDSKEEAAGRKLGELGLKLVQPRYYPAECNLQGEETKAARWGASEYVDAAVPGFLAVAWNHQALSEIFAKSKWNNGVWRQPLARSEGALDGVKVSLGKGMKANATLVPLCAIFDDEDLPPASRREALLAWLATQQGGGA